MLFNSIAFIVFFIIFYILYWFIFNKTLRLQNSLLLVASYYFYSQWDWRFVFLLFASTLIDYIVGIILADAKRQRLLILWIGISLNLSILVFFKYYNFFTNSFTLLMHHMGMQ